MLIPYAARISLPLTQKHPKLLAHQKLTAKGTPGKTAFAIPVIWGQNFGIVAAQSGIVTPPSIRGLTAWYRGDTKTLVGSKVSVWQNKIEGLANSDLLQGTDADRPTFTASDAAYNNKPTLTFDGAATFMQSGAWGTALVQPYTVMVVGNDDGNAAVETYTAGLSAGEGSVLNAGGTYKIGAGTALGTGAAIATKHLIGGLFRGITSAEYLGAATPQATGNAGVGGLTGLTVGANTVPGGYLPGKLAEVLVWNRALTHAEIDAMGAYLVNEYAIPFVP